MKRVDHGALAESADFAGGKLRIRVGRYSTKDTLFRMPHTIVLYERKGSIFDTFIWYRKYRRIGLYQLPCQLSY